MTSGPRTRPALSALLGLVLIAGCSAGPSRRPDLAVSGSAAAPTVAPSSSAAPRPTGPGGPGQQADPLKWRECPDDVPASSGRQDFQVDCATVAVPEDRVNTPDDNSLDLSVARARATTAPPDAPPLVVVSGQPGVNGRNRVAAVAASLDPAILAKFTIVVLDVRGTGASWNAERCFRDSTLTDLVAPVIGIGDSTEADSVTTMSKNAVFDCADSDRTRITDVTTTAAADDLDSLRAAMGVQSIAYLGVGWGATLGATYVDRYPGRVSAAVLDSPTDSTLTADAQVSSQADALENALDAFAADCTSSGGGCPLGTDPRQTVQKIVADLGDSGERGQDWYISGGSVLSTLALTLGDPSSWPDLTQALVAARGGKLEALETMLLDRLTAADRADLVEPQLEYRCNDSSIRPTAAAMLGTATMAAKSAPLFGPYLAAQQGLCTAWPAAVAPLGRITGTGAPTVLVTGSSGDPVSPFGGVRSVSGQLSSAVLVAWQSGQHGAVAGSSCVRAVAVAYLTAGTSPTDGLLCPP